MIVLEWKKFFRADRRLTNICSTGLWIYTRVEVSRQLVESSTQVDKERGRSRTKEDEPPGWSVHHHLSLSRPTAFNPSHGHGSYLLPRRITYFQEIKIVEQPFELNGPGRARREDSPDIQTRTFSFFPHSVVVVLFFLKETPVYKEILLYFWYFFFNYAPPRYLLLGK